MTKVLIIEDEGVAARRISKMVESRGLIIAGVCPSLTELEEYLNQNPEPDLYLMDIHLNDGIIFEYLQEHELASPIIFTTAYDQYAIRAFKQNSIDYLLKPINDEELDQALEQYEKLASKTQSFDIQALSQMILNKTQQQEEYRERFRVKIGDKFKSISIEDIAIIYSENRMSFLHTNEGRSYPIEYSVESLATSLNPKKFHRVNRSHIVSIDYINEVIAYSNSRLKIKVEHAPDQEIIVSRERVKDFKNWLG